MRKLKKQSNRIEEEKKEPLKKKIIYKKNFKVKNQYKKKINKQCDYFLEDGTQCRSNAAGKGNFCSIHADHIFHDKKACVAIQGGITTKFDPINHPRMYIEMSAQGMNKHEIAAEFGTSVETMEKWKEGNEFFAMACEIGKSALEAWYLRTGKDNLDNRWFQTNLYKYLTMNNGMGWSDKAETRSQVQGQFGVLLVPGQMSLDEWEQQNIVQEQELQQKIDHEAETDKI